MIFIAYHYNGSQPKSGRRRSATAHIFYQNKMIVLMQKYMREIFMRL